MEHLSSEDIPTQLSLGIDPGTQYTGYGIVGCRGHEFVRVESGVWALHSYKTEEERLYTAQRSLEQLLKKHSCKFAGLEDAFFGKNAQSMLKLGRLQGVILATLWAHQVSISTYTPTALKRSISGHGQASKEVLASRIGLLINEPEYIKGVRLDESDALGIAICCLLHNTS